MEWSGYQKDIFKQASDMTTSFHIEAKAGTGKTTVMVEIANACGLGEKFLFVAFSKLIAETLKKKLPKNHCSTLHALGYNVLRKHVPRTEKWVVDGYKYLKVLQAHLEPIQQKKGKKSNSSHIKPTEYQLLLQKAEDEYEHGAGLYMISEVISKMMVTLTPPNTDAIMEMADMYNVNLPLMPDEMAEVAARTIALGREAAFNGGLIDFNEMLYWPTMERWQVGSYHTVGIDEAQDLNNCQQQFLTLIRKERVISVGDKAQSIFMFAGARCDSIANLRKLFGDDPDSGDEGKWMKQLPLSICYRCDKEIIRHAQNLVPDIEYHPGKPEGIVREIRDQDLIENLQSGAFILCRLNAPLVSKCFQLIIEGIAAKIRGKDVAEQLIKTIYHIAQSRTFDISNFSYHLDHYYDLEMGKIIRRGGRREKALLGMLADRIQCLQSFYDNVQPSSVYELTDAIKALFKEGGNARVTLMSAHKSKGLEAPQVMIIEPNKLPLCFNGQSEEEMQQEKNLTYVARTRAEHELIYVNKDSE